MSGRAEKRLVFDPSIWGGKDCRNNEHCWKLARILAVEGHGPRQVAAVQFEHDGRVSRGHFTNGMRPAPASAVPRPDQEE